MATAETTTLPVSVPAPPATQEIAKPEYVVKLEERLLALERHVHGLQARIDVLAKAANRDEKPWWKRGASMADNPAFDEIVRLGKEFRESDRPKD